MKSRPWFIVVVLGCALTVFAPAPAVADGGAADVFQASYDAEALGKWQDALAAVERLPSPQKNSYVAHLRRGYLLYVLAKYADSVDAYSKAAGLAAGAVEPRVGALGPLVALRRWADVERVAREVLKLDPANYLANLRLAYAYYNLARYGEAALLYKKLADLYPGDVEVRSGLGWSLLKAGKAAEGASQFRSILEIAPKHALAREGLTAAGGAP